MNIVPSQIVVGVIGVVALILVLSLMKKAIKWVIGVAVLLICGVWIGVLSPQQAIDTVTAIKDRGMATYQRLADASQNIKIQGESISIRINDTWLDLNAVNSFKVDGDTVKVEIGGNSYSVTDKNIAKLFETFSDN